MYFGNWDALSFHSNDYVIQQCPAYKKHEFKAWFPLNRKVSQNVTSVAECRRILVLQHFATNGNCCTNILRHSATLSLRHFAINGSTCPNILRPIAIPEQ